MLKRESKKRQFKAKTFSKKLMSEAKDQIKSWLSGCEANGTPIKVRPGRFITLAWEEIDRPPSQKLAAIKPNGGKVRALISSITHPTSWETIVKFLSQFADGQHIVYQAALTSAIRDADLRSHDIAVVDCHLVA